MSLYSHLSAQYEVYCSKVIDQELLVEREPLTSDILCLFGGKRQIQLPSPRLCGYCHNQMVFAEAFQDAPPK